MHSFLLLPARYALSANATSAYRSKLFRGLKVVLYTRVEGVLSLVVLNILLNKGP